MIMRYTSTMELAHGFRSNVHHNKVNNVNTRFPRLIRSRDHHCDWVLKLMARALLLALIIVSLSWLGSIIGGPLSSKSNDQANVDFSFVEIDSMNVELLQLLFRDLVNEGLFRIGARALLVGDDNNEEIIYNSEILNDNEMDMISYSDSDRQSLIPDETFDFTFARSFQSAMDFIDRTLKVGGIAAVQLSENPSLAFPKPTNYKIVYLRRFDSTVMAMRKTGSTESTKMPAQRRLFGISSEAKKEALKNLEDVLLEPPRAASGKSKRYLKRTRYLPDLTGDTLESYPRRLFIDVAMPGKNNSGWFTKHYPTRNKDFEIYKIDMVTTEEAAGGKLPEIGMSDWLWENVNEDEYVVMKAEAEVVEEMVKSRAIVLVDELFMECKPRGLSKRSKSSRRAYWECLALYGKLRDEGVAVHQWWG